MRHQIWVPAQVGGAQVGAAQVGSVGASRGRSVRSAALAEGLGSRLFARRGPGSLDLAWDGDEKHDVAGPALWAPEATLQPRQREALAPRPNECAHVQLFAVSALGMPRHAVLIARGATGGNAPAIGQSFAERFHRQ